MMGDGFGAGGMVFGVLLMVGVLLLVGLGIWALVVWLRRSRSQSGDSMGTGPIAGSRGSRAREVLDERYARGELTIEEYHEKLETLGE